MKLNLRIILSVLQFCKIIGLSTSVDKKGHCSFNDDDKDILTCHDFAMADINAFSFQKITPDKMHVNIKRLHFVDSHFDSFTRYFFGHFYGSLQVIWAHKCEITDIIDGTFGNVPNVTHLFLQSNGIEKLRSKTFYNLKKLIDLNLRLNYIETIEADTFENLTRLEMIYLDYNNIKFISSNTFEMIKNIEVLYFSNNLINGELILNINKIKEFSAKNCGLTRFSLSINSGEIQTLSLSKNNLKEVFIGEFKVKWLDLSRNQIKRINIDGSELIDLNLQKNPLDYENIQNDFDNMAQLEYLYLEDTNLVKLNKDMFKSMSNLKHLSLARNPLKERKARTVIREIPNLKASTIDWGV